MFKGWKQHFEVLRESLLLDREARANRQLHAEPEFLPAALEILERPPSPVGRLVLWLLMGFLFLALLWACLGKLDVVATADGKIIPRGNVKLIQSADLGVVRKIYVVDVNMAGGGIRKRSHEADQRRLPGTGGSHQRGYRAGPRIERESTQDGFAGVVFESDILESDVPLDTIQLFDAGRVVIFRTFLQYFVHPVESRKRLCNLRADAGDLKGRSYHEAQKKSELEEVSDRNHSCGSRQ